MRIVLVSALSSLAAGIALSQSPSALSARADVWTSLGPDGGSADILVVDPQNPETVYASTPGGLFKSTDGAASWTLVRSLRASANIGSLVVDPHNSGTIYAATAADSANGAGGEIFKSTDGGATWQTLQSGSVFALSAPLAIDPQHSNVLYSATYNAALKTTAILKTEDGGASWTPSTIGLPVTCCPFPSDTLIIDRNDPANVYASLNTGFFKSTNGGASWRAVYTYTIDKTPCFQTLALDPQNPGTLYGMDSGRGVFRSTDSGATWKAINSGLPTFMFYSLAFDPQKGGTLYVATLLGIYKSTDGGANWQAAGLGSDGVTVGAPLPFGQEAPVEALAVDPLHPGTLYASKPAWTPRAGIYKSTDGGATWILTIKGLRAMAIGGLAIDRQHPGTIYASAGGFGRLKTTDAGTNWEKLPASGTGPLALDAGSILYAGVQALENDENAVPGGPSVRVIRSEDGGATWNAANAPLPQSCASVLSLDADPSEMHTVYASFNSFDWLCQSPNTGGLWRTSDGGASWTKLAPPPKGGDGDGQGGGGGMHGVAIDPQSSSTLYGWNGWGFFKSTDRGASWDTLNSGFQAKAINRVVIDPQTSATLYAVLDGDGIFKSVDGGTTWGATNSGLPTQSVDGSQKYLVTSLVVDPSHPDTLYAGAGGVYRSTDGGATWNSINTGLTSPAVFTLAIDPQNTRTVYASTSGGVFRSVSGGPTSLEHRVDIRAPSGIVPGPAGPVRSSDFTRSDNGVARVGQP